MQNQQRNGRTTRWRRWLWRSTRWPHLQMIARPKKERLIFPPLSRERWGGGEGFFFVIWQSFWLSDWPLEHCTSWILADPLLEATVIAILLFANWEQKKTQHWTCSEFLKDLECWMDKQISEEGSGNKSLTGLPNFILQDLSSPSWHFTGLLHLFIRFFSDWAFISGIGLKVNH